MHGRSTVNSLWPNFEGQQIEKAIVGNASNPKKVSMLTWFALVLTIVVLSPTPYAGAQEPGEAPLLGEAAADSGETTPLPEQSYKEPTKNLATLALGGALWPSLGNTEFGTTSAATRPGHVSSGGLAFETAYHRHIAHWERGNLYLGAEFGGFNFDNKDSVDPTQPSTGQPIKGDLDARVWYAGPSIQFMMGEGRFKYFLGAGGGYYQLALTESDEIPKPTCTNFGPCFETKRSLHRSAIGGYVSLGVDLAAFHTESGWEWRLRLEDKIHLVNFGSLDSFSPGTGNLSGPINIIQFGVVAGF
jgi:hypothetical protein